MMASMAWWPIMTAVSTSPASACAPAKSADLPLEPGQAGIDVVPGVAQQRHRSLGGAGDAQADHPQPPGGLVLPHLKTHPARLYCEPRWRPVDGAVPPG